MISIGFFEGTARPCYVKFGSRVYLELGTYMESRVPGVQVSITRFACGISVGQSFWGLTY